MGGAHGWNDDHGAACVVAGISEYEPARHPPVMEGVRWLGKARMLVSVWGVIGALLGSQDTDRVLGLWSTQDPHHEKSSCWEAWCVVVCVACCLRITQWTRASSICDLKFLRAHGGCLGTRNR